jgi:hypothetical protein
MVDTSNKYLTGEFKYKLFLPQALNNKDEEFDKLSLINLKPIRMHPFTVNCYTRYAYSPIEDDKVLLLSA